ncbi:hypothetical protein ALSL_0377 [Aerosticca soli]|uniref:Uncharacterized protein n=1 Tax=Aerosticca soli TaxID=2010829 RepID=A0A2Z6E3D2_9GAMM|nr:hypothetical protein ALSL_0377 [Aerosticca soli]
MSSGPTTIGGRLATGRRLVYPGSSHPCVRPRSRQRWLPFC